MNSTAYILGFAVGVTIVLVIALVVSLIAKKKGGPAEYDERQQFIRGKAYKAAFWALVTYLLVNGMFQIATGIEWADLMTSSFIGICLSMTIFVVVCIKNDAYFAINQNPKLYYVLFGILIAVNMTVGMINLFDNDVQFITDGRLNYHVMNFVVVIVFLVIIISLSAKMIAAKRNANRGESYEKS